MTETFCEQVVMTTPTARELEAKRERLRRWIPREKKGTTTQGVDHIAVFAKDMEVTAAFCNDVLGMPVVNVTSNRDVPDILTGVAQLTVP